jgi:hypothetical protein
MRGLENYEPVADRLARFWVAHPNGRILTEVQPYATGPDRWVIVASVWRDTEELYPAATGLAEEIQTTRGVNSTSAAENAETSAIGRALANLGMGGAGKPRPSAEEMAKVQRAEPPPAPPAAESLARIDAAAQAIGMDRAGVTSRWRARNGVDLDRLPMADPADLAALAAQVEQAATRRARAAE